jgi:exodeoxyribonuclease VII small subunit
MAASETLVSAPLSYEAARLRIRECVRLLSAGELELNSMIDLFEEACRLTEQIEQQLQNARLRVAEISDRYLERTDQAEGAGL